MNERQLAEAKVVKLHPWFRWRKGMAVEVEGMGGGILVVDAPTGSGGPLSVRMDDRNLASPPLEQAVPDLSELTTAILMLEDFVAWWRAVLPGFSVAVMLRKDCVQLALSAEDAPISDHGVAACASGKWDTLGEAVVEASRQMAERVPQAGGL